MINQENYEGYLFRYQEDDLDAVTRAEVEEFLRRHPAIRQEMEQFYDPELVVTATKAAKRSLLGAPLRWAAAACLVAGLGCGVHYLALRPDHTPAVAVQQAPVRPAPAALPADESEARESESATLRRHISAAAPQPLLAQAEMPAREAKQAPLPAAAVESDATAPATAPAPEVLLLAAAEEAEAEAEAPRRIMIPVEGLVRYSEETKPKEMPQKDILGNPLRDDKPLFAMAF